MKIKQNIAIYATIVLGFLTVLGANNYINQSKVPSIPTKNISQQALSNTSTTDTTDTTVTKSNAPAATDTTTETTVKPSTKTSTPKTTIKASTAAASTASTSTVTTTDETPTEPVTPPQPTEQERVYKVANIISANISSDNSKYMITLDKTSVPDLGHIILQIKSIERRDTQIEIVQATSKLLAEANTEGHWLLSSDGKTYTDIYQDDIIITFNGADTLNLYVFIKIPSGTVYQYKYTITKS